MPGYVPEHGDLQDLVERISKQVAATFADAETRLLGQIAHRLAGDLEAVPDLSARLLIVSELEAYAARLTEGMTATYASQFVATASAQGAATAMEHLAWLPSIPQTSMITESQILSVALMAADLGNAYSDMRARILRYPRDAMNQFIVGGDVYQQVIANNAPQALLGSSTSLARRNAVQEFLNRGITGFTDIADRNWRIGTYAEMATRTAVARAYQDGYDHRVSQLGLDLFTVLGGRNACNHCGQWFGKIIASSGPTGRRLVQHATDDRMIAVDVAGTVAEWRDSGAGHPNCTCERVIYLPGLSAATSAEHYDPAAHDARDKLRALERSERAAKRKQGIAEAIGDSEGAAKARRDVLDIQADTRAHVAATGQRRRYERSQVRFSDGRGSIVSNGRGESVFTKAHPSDRRTPFVPDGLQIEAHELATAQRLGDVGMHVRFRPLDNTRGVKNIDTTIAGELWELKSPDGGSKTTISNQLGRAKKQGATRVVIDLARSSLNEAEALAELRRRFAFNEWWASIMLVTRDGTVVKLGRE